MDDGLSRDEWDALVQIGAGIKMGTRPSACVARNAKRLNGLKYIRHGKDGSLTLTDKGQQTLFVKKCIDGLRAVAADPLTVLSVDVATFLGKKSHIQPRPDGSGYDITPKGRESLADMDASAD